LRRLRHYHGCALVTSLPEPVLDRLSPHLLAVLSRWRDDVWWNVLDLLDDVSPVGHARVLRRMEARSAVVGAQIGRYSNRLQVVIRGFRQRHAAAALAHITGYVMRRPSPMLRAA
jgi:hypothetical protein